MSQLDCGIPFGNFLARFQLLKRSDEGFGPMRDCADEISEDIRIKKEPDENYDCD